MQGPSPAGRTGGPGSDGEVVHFVLGDLRVEGRISRERVVGSLQAHGALVIAQGAIGPWAEEGHPGVDPVVGTEVTCAHQVRHRIKAHHQEDFARCEEVSGGEIEINSATQPPVGETFGEGAGIADFDVFVAVLRGRSWVVHHF